MVQRCIRGVSATQKLSARSERSQEDVEEQMRGMAEADAEVVQKGARIVDYLLPSII